jgi:DNA-binding transcriptional ArsR family regulator
MKSLCKAVAHDNHSRMLLMKDREEIQTRIGSSSDFTPAASSTHLRVLKEAGLVGEIVAYQDRAYYSVNKEKISVVMDFSVPSRDEEHIRSKGDAEGQNEEEEAGRR